MRIILIGRGQVGHALMRGLAGHKIEHWTRDIADLSSEAIGKFLPDIIINAAGKTDLAWCEANPLEAFRSNVEAPLKLYQRICSDSPEVRFIHLSSGCVWDGPYDE